MTPDLDLIEKLAGEATPGPWHVSTPDKNLQPVVAGEHFEIATFWHHCVGSIEKQAHANAHLVAALPPETALYLVRVAKAAGEFLEAVDLARQGIVGGTAARERTETALRALLTPETQP